jgi:Cu-processing system permease protein
MSPSNVKPDGIIAGKEFWDRIRNRWVLAVALVFTVFALVIAYFRRAQQGMVGFRSIESPSRALVSLVIYLIPLIALILGFDAIVGERERGSLDLLLLDADHALRTVPRQILGLAGALAFSTVAGFRPGGVVLSAISTLNALAHLRPASWRARPSCWGSPS